MRIRNTTMFFLAAALAVTALSRVKAQTPPWAKVSPEQEAAARKLGVPLAFENSLGMRFVLIPPGKFMMGSRDPAAEVAGRCAMPNANAGWFADEHPRHEVTLSSAFYIAIHEVTQGSYETIVSPKSDKPTDKKISNDYPVGFKGANHPVVKVAWNDAEKFCKALNAQADEQGREYALPTEAQWEYACRAGMATPFSFGETLSTDQANYHGGYTYGDGQKGVYRKMPLPVGSLPPNAWGLYDMHGNVSEWCADLYGKYGSAAASDPQGPSEGGSHVLRGGSWRSYPGACRCACRLSEGDVSFNIGFRVRCAVPTKALLLKVPEVSEAAKVKVKAHFEPLFKEFGRNSTTKVEIVSGPEKVKMNNGGVPGKQWIATFGKHRFKLTIQDATGVKLEQLVERLQKLPGPYMKACAVVSDDGEDGIAIYANLGGAAAHGGQSYINIVPNADALVIAHESGHTLEQFARASEPKMLDMWEGAIKEDKISISDYGDHVRHEDLAEFAMVYAVCLGAGPKHLTALKNLSPARFALWERILQWPDRK
ncbi:MAG: formylglycine-generating enzyme family protein [Verrucomicrobia bacterium]|nr:formylglycine-generating enzyme family protein [Verrucomicrobiota bacterium]